MCEKREDAPSAQAERGAAPNLPEGQAVKMCKCGRGPWRSGQRNCIYCNREANAAYRNSLKLPIDWGRDRGTV